MSRDELGSRYDPRRLDGTRFAGPGRAVDEIGVDERQAGLKLSWLVFSELERNDVGRSWHVLEGRAVPRGEGESVGRGPGRLESRTGQARSVGERWQGTG